MEKIAKQNIRGSGRVNKVYYGQCESDKFASKKQHCNMIINAAATGNPKH